MEMKITDEHLNIQKEQIPIKLPENIYIDQLTDGILKIEFKLNNILYCGTVFSQDIDRQDLSDARALYETCETLRKQKTSKKYKKRKGKYNIQKKPRRIATNLTPRFRMSRYNSTLSAKISRELDELSSQEELSQSESRLDIKTEADSICSPQTSNDNSGTVDEQVDMKEQKTPSAVKKFYKKIGHRVSKKGDQYSDISEESRDSQSMVKNSNFGISDLCGPSDQSVQNPPQLNIPSSEMWGNVPQMSDNYSILKENRDMNNICASIKSGNRFNMPPNCVADMHPRRAPFFANMPNCGRPEQFISCPNRHPNLSQVADNGHRPQVNQNDFLKYFHSFLNAQNPMANPNPALLAAMYQPFCVFPRGPQNPASGPMGVPNMPTDVINMMRPYNLLPGIFPRFPQPTSNPRGNGNPTVNGVKNIPRE